MTLNAPLFLQLAGGIHFFIAAANFFLPAKLHYHENLAKVSPIIRQIFYVHGAYIVLVLIGFGGLCLGFTQDLLTTPLGHFFIQFLAFFWTARVIVQFAYYDDAIKKTYPWGNRLFSLLFLFLALTFTCLTFRPI